MPTTDCAKQDVVDAIEQTEPLDALVDLATLYILANKICAMLNVPRWQKVGAALGYASFSDASTSKSVALFTLSAKGVIHAVKIKHSTAFAGTGILTVKMSVGIAGATAKYGAPLDVMQAVGDMAFGFNHEVGAETHNATGTGIVVTAEATGANLDQLTAGVVDVWVLHSATL
jgi:hypothetical protein